MSCIRVFDSLWFLVALMVEDIVATSAREGGPVSYSTSSGFRPKNTKYRRHSINICVLINYCAEGSSVTKLLEQLSKLVETRRKVD